MTIKARLTIAVVAVLVVATATLGWVMVTSTRRTLTNQIDDELRTIARRRPDTAAAATAPQGEDEYRATTDLVYSADGEPISLRRAGDPDDPDALPSLPEIPSTQLDEILERVVTRPAVDGDTHYRVLAERLGNGDYRILATSLSETDTAVSRLLVVFLVTGLVVLVIGALTSWVVIRRGLRPVDRMIDTASAIAGGEHSQRINHRDDRSELGRLAAALDEMLARLEASLDDRESARARLERFVADASHELRTPVAAIRGLRRAVPPRRHRGRRGPRPRDDPDRTGGHSRRLTRRGSVAPRSPRRTANARPLHRRPGPARPRRDR
ncbi:MAG TPA: HAMP domain-containing protein [Acidimicrobiia bacterium]|nr:HAMP domain-containing protein [Acidimicrobiia bacterium]